MPCVPMVGSYIGGASMKRRDFIKGNLGRVKGKERWELKSGDTPFGRVR